MKLSNLLAWPMSALLAAILILAGSSPARSAEVVAWGAGSGDYGQTDVPNGLSNVVFIAAGGSNSLAITSNGCVIVWGNNGFGQTNVPAAATNIVSAAIGAFHVLALTADGQVLAWGANGLGATAVPEGLSNIVAVTAGASHSLALTHEGRVVAWGYNANGVCNVPEGLSNVVAIAASAHHSWALKASGDVVHWGASYQYGPGTDGLSNVVAISANAEDAVLSLTGDGRVWHGHFGEIFIGLSNVVAVSAGVWLQGLALTGDGEVLIWNFFENDVPPGLSNVVAIASGLPHRVAMLDPGGLRTSWRLLTPQVVTNGVAIRVPTQRGRSYVVEYKSSLSNAQWAVQHRLAGDGSVRHFIAPAQGFYRARRVP